MEEAAAGADMAQTGGADGATRKTPEKWADHKLTETTTVEARRRARGWLVFPRQKEPRTPGCGQRSGPPDCRSPAALRSSDPHAGQKAPAPQTPFRAEDPWFCGA